jgi:hypothetical protein
MSRQKSALTGVSGVDTVIAGGMLTSARHEPAAVEVARRRLRGRAGLPRRPQAGPADRRPRGERPARSGQPAGGDPADPPYVVIPYVNEMQYASPAPCGGATVVPP